MKKYTGNILIYLLIPFLLYSCGGIKTKFSDEELKWYNVYKVGDVLIFQSSNNQLDTTTIIKKELYYPEYNPGEVHDKYLPQWAEIWYQNKKLQSHPDGNTMITMIKRRPEKQTRLFINYLYGNITFLNLKTDSLKKRKRNQIYELNTYNPKAKPGNPKMIYWHEDYGIIKYITHDNLLWQRINLPK